MLHSLPLSLIRFHLPGLSFRRSWVIIQWGQCSVPCFHKLWHDTSANNNHTYRNTWFPQTLANAFMPSLQVGKIVNKRPLFPIHASLPHVGIGNKEMILFFKSWFNYLTEKLLYITFNCTFKMNNYLYVFKYIYYIVIQELICFLSFIQWFFEIFLDRLNLVNSN